eukprot:6358102-Prymnesium_polylepis.1
MVGQLARPDDGRCACGKSLRYECAPGCKPFQIAVREGTPVLQKVGCAPAVPGIPSRPQPSPA